MSQKPIIPELPAVGKALLDLQPNDARRRGQSKSALEKTFRADPKGERGHKQERLKEWDAWQRTLFSCYNSLKEVLRDEKEWQAEVPPEEQIELFRRAITGADTNGIPVLHIGNMRSWKKRSLLEQAFNRKAYWALEVLLESNIDANIRINSNSKNIGCTLLHEACRKGDFRTVKLLLETPGSNAAGVLNFVQPSNDMTPFLYAVEYGNLELVKYLAEKGVQLDAKARKRTALHFATDPEVLNWVLDELVAKDIIDVNDNEAGLTALDLACHGIEWEGSMYRVQRLLGAGADPYAGKKHNAFYHLMREVSPQRLSSMMHLKKPETNLAEYYAPTRIRFSSYLQKILKDIEPEQASVEMYKRLQRMGYDLSTPAYYERPKKVVNPDSPIQNYWKTYPTHIAVRSCSPKRLEWLLENGSEYLKSDEAGYTILDAWEDVIGEGFVKDHAAKHNACLDEIRIAGGERVRALMSDTPPDELFPVDIQFVNIMNVGLKEVFDRPHWRKPENAKKLLDVLHTQSSLWQEMNQNFIQSIDERTNNSWVSRTSGERSGWARGGGE